jgi:hypothetical protein
MGGRAYAKEKYAREKHAKAEHEVTKRNAADYPFAYVRVLFFVRSSFVSAFFRKTCIVSLLKIYSFCIL